VVVVELMVVVVLTDDEFPEVVEFEAARASAEIVLDPRTPSAMVASVPFILVAILLIAKVAIV
jgi:hypothetical protein